MSKYIQSIDYRTEIPAAGHWSLRLRRGSIMRLIDIDGGANVGMLFFNPENLLERLNIPDTLKCQQTFRITAGHCLYSDMGRIFASVVSDSFGWHDAVCGNSRASHISRWGARNYQHDRNDWRQNGHDAMLVEMAKYGLVLADMPANINWFSKVESDAEGVLRLNQEQNKAGSEVVLRFEMDTLVVLHNCPHPFNTSEQYPRARLGVELGQASALAEDDLCKNTHPENGRGFANNALYYLAA